MRFSALPVTGVLLIKLDWRRDDRGGFARSFCAREFAAAGVTFEVSQCNISSNHEAGTVRGLHYQVEPVPEAKIVRCIQGRAFDVAVDLRSDSPTYLQWCSIELTAENALSIYIPPGVAHGFQTLQDETTLHYTMGAFFSAEHQRGARWNDPAFGINWPLPVTALSGKDAGYPDFVA